eukprot:7066818-Ditylum_brightwellii.AAC.1
MELWNEICYLGFIFNIDKEEEGKVQINFKEDETKIVDFIAKLDRMNETIMGGFWDELATATWPASARGRRDGYSQWQVDQ